MTKIPIFLSILSLAGGSSLNPLNINTAAVQSQPASAAKAHSLTEDARIIANENVAGINFTDLSLAMGQLNWEFQYQDAEGRTFSRYVMASHNFMGGVTEAEADQKLATLGTTNWNDWTNWRVDYAARDGHFVPGTKLGATIAMGNPLRMNQSDIIYYAFEYKNWDNPSVKPVWYRGKLDYRACAHTPDIESRYGMTCKISLDSATNRYNITPAGGTLSYDDEMAQIIRESYLDPLRQQIADLEKRKAAGDESYRNGIDGAEYSLNEARQQIEIMHLTATLADELANLEQRIAQLRQEDTTQPEISQPETDQPGVGDGDDTGNNIQDNDQGDTKDEIQSGVAQLGVDSQAAPKELSSTNNSATTTKQVINKSEENKNLVSSDGSDSDNLRSDIDDRSESESYIEIPDLGKEEPWLKRHPLALLLPVGLIALVIVILVKRHREENEDEI